ncbi:peptidylprolyl isomerase [Cohnella suwonensis]|uniref:peptidylprolyl isomerase n=1 Tax=Cohnella suwonensis TaxID=696072 RepID=A0ABW0LQK3_9BACL
MEQAARYALTVNDKKLSLRRLLRRARVGDTMPVVEQSVDSLALECWAEQLGLKDGTEELQTELTLFRKSRGLFTVQQTNAWLFSRGLKLEDVVDVLRPRTLRRKIADHIVSEHEIERYFYENKLQYDRAEISKLATMEYGEAQEMLFRLEEGADFHTLARRFSIDDATRKSGGYAGFVDRSVLEPEVAARVFAGNSGGVLGPFAIKTGYLLVHVEAIYPAELDAEVRQDIRERLFEYKFEAYQNKLDIHEFLWEL